MSEQEVRQSAKFDIVLNPLAIVDMATSDWTEA